MMVYAMLDVKAREYGSLVLGANHQHVMRAIRDGIPGSGSTVEKYPEDFHLMHLGSFDPESGVLVPVAVPVLVAVVREILEVSHGG